MRLWLLSTINNGGNSTKSSSILLVGSSIEQPTVRMVLLVEKAWDTMGFERDFDVLATVDRSEKGGNLPVNNYVR